MSEPPRPVVLDHPPRDHQANSEFPDNGILCSCGFGITINNPEVMTSAVLWQQFYRHTCPPRWYESLFSTWGVAGMAVVSAAVLVISQTVAR